MSAPKGRRARIAAKMEAKRAELAGLEARRERGETLTPEELERRSALIADLIEHGIDRRDGPAGRFRGVPQ